MITPLDRYDLPRMSRPELEQAITELEQDADELSWEIEWRNRELGAVRSAVTQVQAFLGGRKRT